MFSVGASQLAVIDYELTLSTAILADLRLRAVFDYVTLFTAAAASHGRLVRAILRHVTILVASAADNTLHRARVRAVSFVVSV